jgi:hypothetical protein
VPQHGFGVGVLGIGEGVCGKDFAAHAVIIRRGSGVVKLRSGRAVGQTW